MMLSKRQTDILSILTKAKNLITSDWIAKQLGVSDRTVRNEIKEIQLDGPNLGISVESTRGKGYHLHIVNQPLFSSQFDLLTKTAENKDHFSNQNDRVLYILRSLLLGKEAIKLESFKEKIFVSQSTLNNDMKLVRHILKKYHLKLVNKPYHGTMIEGKEYWKRLCFSHYAVSRQNDGKRENAFFSFLDQGLAENIKNMILQKVKEFNINISDISLENLAIHIAIACKRVKENFIIEPIKENFAEEYPFEKKVATEIVKEVENDAGLVFPDSEINYIVVHLLGTKLLPQKELIEYGKYDEAGHIVACMLERLRTKLNWDFRHDREFIQSLTLHIRPAMNRLRYHMGIRNPFLNKIKEKYPSAFDGAVIASKCIEDYLSLKPGEHEIAYIALHIAVALEHIKRKQERKKRAIVVCASGVGSAKLLFYHLKDRFMQELDIIDSISYYRLDEYDLTSIDFIISTVPIKKHVTIPIILVNAFLEKEDVQQIKNYLHRETSQPVSPYLDISRVFIQQDFKTKKEVIHFLCDKLSEQGLIPKDYKKLVFEREALAPTSFGNLVAIPHTLMPVTEETFWAICTLKRPIIWHDSQRVQFICLLNVKRGPKGDLNHMYQKLIKIVENKAVIQEIIKCTSVSEVIRLLEEHTD